jgi:hypothetical protein
MEFRSPSPYRDTETFGKDYIEEHYVNKIKNILNAYHNNPRVMRSNINAIKEDYDELLANGNVLYESWEKTDMFNELIVRAKKEIADENVTFRNNAPYNPFNSDDFRGGKSRKYKSRKHKNKTRKHKHKSRKNKHKSRKHKRSSK